MSGTMEDIARQAHQGSVVAIIQTLNERLADFGVRTRAILADGVLQVLCEAAKPEQLEQSILVSQIQEILEEISPRNIRRVRINSRIVREEQLLWLEEISRDPDNQLLWYEDITLTRPNFFKQLAQTFNNRQNLPSQQLALTPGFSRQLSQKKLPSQQLVLPPASYSQLRKKGRLRQGVVIGLGLGLFLILVGWLLNDWFGREIESLNPTQADHSAKDPANSSSSGSSSNPDPPFTRDPFTEAMRLAQEAAAAGESVETSAQWLDVAAKWERASNLMETVKPDDQRYQIARYRVILYRKNSEEAQKQARKKRS
ncbi:MULTISPECIES: hypothetical protein [unclassified Moorena]|uniref:hypothetical protein n=1 Tax=unclassified Moorena TaxID=2683338 RepID=UPI0013B64F63|nr:MULTISPECIES: hypothetical protein [unclassified Moorena]NEQ14485.1 hypothetical protein [Moorena sp. SIO3E2]NES84585.1 hypothetical protein [Moorena sp. SIO2B7]NEP30987.1 hypothetical protein [Moorena sp. SIO3B2]NEP65320.1 hypothetical protein [Moorena sp. SIO3A5]NEQ11875.1 hypothetical protein [Moorena sp. SIO4E2]